MPKEIATYFTYNEGLEAKHLHLGNLVHDYKDPNSVEPYVEKAYTDIAEPAPAWAQSTPLQNYALTLRKTSAKDDDDDGDADESSSPPRYSVAASEKTTKLEIKDPSKFFTETTLASPTAKKWLLSRLSAAEALSTSVGEFRPRPEIWMLTGLILMTHATWTSLSSPDPSFIPGLQAPFDPTGVSAIRRLSVSDGVKPTFGFRASDDDGKQVEGAVIHETGKYPGMRGWAARWQRVDVRIGGEEKWKEGVNNLFRLKGVKKIAMVELEEDEFAEMEDEDEEDEGDFDEEYWDAFLDAAEEYQ